MQEQDAIPRPLPPDEVESEFAAALRAAAWVFENEKDGRFSGSIAACQAVIPRMVRRPSWATRAA